jgi:hypothetical protein
VISIHCMLEVDSYGLVNAACRCCICMGVTCAGNTKNEVCWYNRSIEYSVNNIQEPEAMGVDLVHAMVDWKRARNKRKEQNKQPNECECEVEVTSIEQDPRNNDRSSNVFSVSPVLRPVTEWGIYH